MEQAINPLVDKKKHRYYGVRSADTRNLARLAPKNSDRLDGKERSAGHGDGGGICKGQQDLAPHGNDKVTTMIKNRRSADVPVLTIGSHRLEVQQLTEYGFQFPSVDLSDQADAERILSGSFQHDDTGMEIPVRFVVRRTAGGVAHGGFKDQTLAEKKQLETFIKTIENPATDGVLTSMTYDELAEGTVPRQSRAAEKKEKKSEAKQAAEKSASFKTLVAMLMALAMLAILVAVVASVRMRYSVKIVNAVMVGNCLPINTPTDGEVAEVLVSQGQEVTEGDTLFVLRNQMLELEHEKLGSALRAAETEVVAIEQMVIDHKVKVKLARQRVDYEIAAAKADLRKAQSELRAATSKVNRLTPLYQRKNIGMAEYDEAVSMKDAAIAECEARSTAIESLQIAKQAAAKDMLFLGDRIDSRPSELRAQRDIADARVEQLKRDLLSSEKRARQIEIKAPRSGSVYAIYRRSGEYMKVGEEALAMSLNDGWWASGHVPAEQATKIRPGQTVELIIPSLDMTTNGVVAAVGHRAVYGKGGYLNDFRPPTPNDVPIKVQVQDLSGEIPAGLRLNMIVQLDNDWEWLDKLSLKKGLSWLKGVFPKREGQEVEPEQESASSDTKVSAELPAAKRTDWFTHFLPQPEEAVIIDNDENRKTKMSSVALATPLPQPQL